MAKITLMGDASGQVDLVAPAAAGSTTLTLPSATGNVIASTATQASVDNAVTNKIKIEINGVIYYLLATTSNA